MSSNLVQTTQKNRNINQSIVLSILQARKPTARHCFFWATCSRKYITNHKGHYFQRASSEVCISTTTFLFLLVLSFYSCQPCCQIIYPATQNLKTLQKFIFKFYLFEGRSWWRMWTKSTNFNLFRVALSMHSLHHVPSTLFVKFTL